MARSVWNSVHRGGIKLAALSCLRRKDAGNGGGRAVSSAGDSSLKMKGIRGSYSRDDMDLKKKRKEILLAWSFLFNILLRIFFRVESYSILNSWTFLAIQFLSLRSKLASKKDKLGLLFKAKFFGIQSIFRFIFRKVLWIAEN